MRKEGKRVTVKWGVKQNQEGNGRKSSTDCKVCKEEYSWLKI